jgi:hypothetical protein
VFWFLHEKYNVGIWQDFWNAWVDIGCLVPFEPLDLERGWYCENYTVALNFYPRLFRLIIRAEIRLVVSLTMTCTFGIYGGLHLLAWQ